MNKVLESLLVRQAFQESRFDPKAISKVGAQGLTQFMPKTWEDFQKASNDYTLDVFNPSDAIKGQKWYMNWLDNYIASKDPSLSEEERAPWVLTAYNYGPKRTSELFNNLVKEGRDTTNVSEWINRIPKETRDYVNTILYKKDPIFETKFNTAIENNLKPIEYSNLELNTKTSNNLTGVISTATKERWTKEKEREEKIKEENLEPIVYKFEPFSSSNYLNLLHENTSTAGNKPVQEVQEAKETPELFINVFDNLKKISNFQPTVPKFVVPSFREMGGVLKIKK